MYLICLLRGVVGVLMALPTYHTFIGVRESKQLRNILWKFLVFDNTQLFEEIHLVID